LHDPYTRAIQPWELLRDANKHLGQRPQAKAGVSVQRGAPTGVDVAAYGLDRGNALTRGDK
jgi:hypothetical protein